MPCIMSCPCCLPCNPEEWCAGCREEYQRQIEDCSALAMLSLAAEENAAHLPATEAEWLRRLDDLAPLTEDAVA